MGLYFEDFDQDVEYQTRGRTVTEADVVAFAGLSGDFNPLHVDAEFMEASVYGERIAHGMLIGSIATGLSSQMGWLDGTILALMEITWRFVAAVRFGDTIHLVLKLKEKRETSKPDRGVVILDADVVNQRGETVVTGIWTTMMARRPA